MKRIKLRKIWYLSIIFFIILLLFPSVHAGEDANLDEELNISATPPQQGSGGPISITILATFYGGCCYPLYGYDVSAELTLPAGVELVEDIKPSKINKFEAKAGGGAVQAQFKCAVKSYIPGEYELESLVTTSNCGNAKGSVRITITEGCVISTPETFPEQPVTDKNINIKLSAYSPLDEVNIENVKLYYLTFPENIINNPEPKNELLNWEENSKEGLEISFELMEFNEDYWKGEIPKQSSESVVVYWLVAEDNFGNKTTSPAYTFAIKNMERIHFQHNTLIWITLISSCIGVIFVGIIWSNISKRSDKDGKKLGFKLIGTPSLNLNNKNSEGYDYQVKMNKYRNFALLLIFIVAIILILYAFQNNFYNLLRTNVGG